MSFQPRRVLVPVELGSPSGQRLAAFALSAAADLSAAHMCKTVVVTVGPGEAKPERTTPELEALLDGYRDRLDVAATDVLHGDDVAAIIAGAAQAHHVDTIVMATHGRQGVSRVLLGSVAEKVLQHSRANVLVLHAPGGEPTPL